VIEDGKLSRIALADLTEADLKAWQLRMKRRRSSMQRVVNDLKAALNRDATAAAARSLRSFEYGLAIPPASIHSQYVESEPYPLWNPLSIQSIRNRV
jgi:hypothetical protein